MPGAYGKGAAAGARVGKKISAMVRGSRSGTSSGAAASGRLAKVTNYVKNNKGKSAMMGAAGITGVGAMRGRRSSGLNKSSGRSTGMYKY